MSDSDSSEDASDWEEVKEEDYDLPALEDDNHESVKEYTQNLNIPTEGISITVEGDGTVPGGRKKGFDAAAYFRRHMNRKRKELQEYMHKASLVCHLARGLYTNSLLRNESLLALAHAIIPKEKAKAPKKIDLGYVESFITWFCKKVTLQEVSEANSVKHASLEEELATELKSCVVRSKEHYVFVFILVLRSLSANVRLVCSLQPIALKPPSSELLQDPERKCSQSDSKTKKNKSSGDKKPAGKQADCSSQTSSKSRKPGKSASLEPQPGHSRRSEEKTPVKRKQSSKSESPKTSRPKRLKRESSRASSGNDDPAFQVDSSNESDPDSDFDLKRSAERPRKKAQEAKRNEAAVCKNSAKTKKAIGKGKKMISSSDDDEASQKTDSKTPDKRARKNVDVWAEVYLEEEEQWLSVDVFSKKVMCDNEFEPKASQPMTYVIALDSDHRIRDVTRRYASKWLTTTPKLRAEPKWWNKTLRPFMGKKTRRDREEDEFLDQKLMNQSMPTSVQEIKNHPLFAMRRHLLKFEALYPPEPPPVGFLKNEAVYSRDCVKTLHSRELWIKQAKVVRIGEAPYKIVKARPKYDKNSGQLIKDRPLELFGEWQVEDYIPPPAVDGKVPRNDYGNVELFLPKMLPKGTVHLREPGLSRVAKKLNIDCAPALVGFDYHSGGSHPVYDGFVVCEEYKDIILDAARADQEEALKREEAKRSKRVRETWRRVIRMVIIRRRLEMKYDMFSASSSSTSSKSKRTAGPSSQSKAGPKVNGKQNGNRGKQNRRRKR